MADLFDEQDPAVLALMAQAIAAAKRAGKYIGICGQGPSDHPALAQWLMDQGIDSVSLNPDSVLSTGCIWRRSRESLPAPERRRREGPDLMARGGRPPEAASPVTCPEIGPYGAQTD